MEKEEKPVPTEARQRILGPAPGQAALTFSEEIPFRFGPRHCGQSSAHALVMSKAAKRTKAHRLRRGAAIAEVPTGSCGLTESTERSRNLQRQRKKLCGQPTLRRFMLGFWRTIRRSQCSAKRNRSMTADGARTFQSAGSSSRTTGLRIGCRSAFERCCGLESPRSAICARVH